MNSRKNRSTKVDVKKCPNCGQEVIQSRTYADTVDFRALELDVEGLRDSKCSVCAHIWVTDEQRAHNNDLIRQAYVAERDRLRHEQGLLTGQDVKMIRESLSLNQREAAALFGGGYNAFNKYESGEVLQSVPMDRLLRLAKAVGTVAVDFLRNLDAPTPFVVNSVTAGTAVHVNVRQHMIALSKLKESASLGRSAGVWLIGGALVSEVGQPSSAMSNAQSVQRYVRGKGWSDLRSAGYEN